MPKRHNDAKPAKWSNNRSTFCIGQLIEKHAGLSSSWEDTEHLGMGHFHQQHVLLLCSGVPLTMWGSGRKGAFELVAFGDSHDGHTLKLMSFTLLICSSQNS